VGSRSSILTSQLSGEFSQFLRPDTVSVVASLAGPTSIART